MFAKLHTVAAVFLLAVLAFLGGAAAGLPAAASTTHAASSHTSLWWDGTTCHAFASGRFHMMVVSSRHADTYLRVDVALLAHDKKVRAPRSVVEAALMDVDVDCTTTGD